MGARIETNTDMCVGVSVVLLFILSSQRTLVPTCCVVSCMIVMEKRQFLKPTWLLLLLPSSYMFCLAQCTGIFCSWHCEASRRSWSWKTLGELVIPHGFCMVAPSYFLSKDIPQFWF
jgi:hypothetical protein